jgi:predicted HAD superfamily Cof-like phosphohydrolase
MTNFQRTVAWLEACGKHPSAENLSVQIGVDAEETAELLSCIRLNHERAQQVLERIVADLEWLGTKLKRGDYIGHIPVHLREMALDALCDRDVTGNATAYLAGMNKDAADQAVLASNDAKLVDGKPVFVEGTSKIGKPAGWKAPDLSAFV